MAITAHQAMIPPRESDAERLHAWATLIASDPVPDSCGANRTRVLETAVVSLAREVLDLGARIAALESKRTPSPAGAKRTRSS